MADENKVFDVEIITPDRVFFTGTATMIEFNTAAGECMRGIFLSQRFLRRGL